MESSTVDYFVFLNVSTGVSVFFFDRKEDGPEYLSCSLLVVC